MNSHADQRSTCRIPYASELIVVCERHAWRAALTDLSEGGCGAFRPEDCDLEEGLLVQLYFLDESNHAFGVDARVARNDPRYLGFEFHEVRPLPALPA
ncbi:hypothetical protein BH11PSE14_BH11PSE14_03170 [soil metagenome]